MKGKAVFLVILGLILSGCATTRTSQVDYLELKVSQLERQLQGKEDEIASLQDEIDSLEMELSEAKVKAKNWETVIAPQQDRPRTGIIRVNQSVEEIQAALKNAGFYQGKIDGKIGNMTKDAIVEFQKANNLKVDGIIGLETWAHLSQHAR